MCLYYSGSRSRGQGLGVNLWSGELFKEGYDEVMYKNSCGI